MAPKKSNILHNIDWSIVIVYIFLVFAGWFNIYSAVYNENASSIVDFDMRYGKQLVWIITAFIFAGIILIIDSGVYYTFSYIIYLLVIISLILVFLTADEIKGARSWWDLGFLRIQPSEFAKLATSLAVSRCLGQYSTDSHRRSYLVETCLLTLIPMALIVLQGDAGSALVFTSFLFVFYREGMPLAVLLVCFGAVLILSFSIIWGATIVSSVIIGVTLLIFVIIAFRKRHRLPHLHILLVCLAFILPIAYYFIFKNGSTATLYFLAGFIILLVPIVIYTYKKKLNIFVILFLIAFGSVCVSESVDYFFTNVLEEHQQKRINVFFGLESDPRGSEFNVIQSKIAIGSGDLFGKGFLDGTQTKNDFVPEQSTDFIFCTIGEEWGFAGSVVIIALFIFLILRIMKRAEIQRSNFSRVYGYCVASILFFHMAINIGMTIGLMPVIGIPLPFFSYGGSSLWGFTMLLFIFVKLDANRDQLIQ